VTGAATDLADLADTFLAACARAVALSPGGSIEYQAVWPGPPAFDCAPSILVNVGGPVVSDTYPLQPPLQPMQRIVTTGIVNQIALTATVLRCVTVIEQAGQVAVFPAPSKITTDAHTTLGDLWAVWNYLVHQHRNGSLFQTPSGRREFALDPAVAVRNQGGFGGWQIPIRVQLGGYDPGT
jgi:hypothetical protein